MGNLHLLYRKRGDGDRFRGYHGSGLGCGVGIPRSKHLLFQNGIKDIGRLTAKTVGRAAFDICAVLALAKLAEGIYQIEAFACYGCTTLQRFHLPKLISTTGQLAFVIAACQSGLSPRWCQDIFVVSF